MNKLEDYISNDLPIKRELLYFLKDINTPVIFDIGACECEDSIRYSELFKNAQIYAFEPLPSNFEKCIKHLWEYNIQNVMLFPFALGSKNDKLKFYVSSGNPDGIDHKEWDYGNKSSSLYEPNVELNKFDWLKFENEIFVDVRTIETFCNERELDSIDFLHIDVQGAELDVLRGAKKYLLTVRLIWIEVENVPLYENQPLRHEVQTFLNAENFFKVKDTAFADSGDQLYINLRYFNVFDIFILRLAFYCRLKRAYYNARKALKSLKRQ